MLSIRQATAQDIPQIRELTFRIWPQTYAPILSNEQVSYMLDMMYSPEVLQRQMDEEGHTFLLCYQDDEPIGFAGYSEVKEGVYKLHKIYILPEKQGIGAGRFMMQYIIDAIRELRSNSLILNVNKYNYPAQAFYQRLGFKTIAEDDIDIGNGYYMNDYIVRLDL